MSAFLYELGRNCYRARKRVLAIWLAVLVLLGALALLLGGKYSDEFEIPGASSQVALDQLRMSIPAAAALQATAIVTVPEGQSVNDPELRAAIEAGEQTFEQLPTVTMVTSPWNEYFTGLISQDERSALLQLELNVQMDEITDAQRAELVRAADQVQAGLPAGTTINMGGQAFSLDVPGLNPTEVLGVIVAAFVLVFTLGSLIAAGLPILIALVGVGASMGVITIATGLASVNSTTPLLAVMLALAVGIDYSLFILSRHRDQLAAGEDLEDSVGKAIGTAGSAVVFAGLTVFIALLGLTVANIPFLSVMGVFAAMAVAISVLVALTLLPAMMGFLGERLRPRPRKKKAADHVDDQVEGSTFGTRLLSRWVTISTKSPLATIIIVTAGLGALAIPAMNLHMSLPHSGQHPPHQTDRITYDLITEHFGVGYNAPLIVTADLITSNDPLGVLDGLRTDIEALPGVKLVAVAVPNPNADMGFVQLIPETGPDDQATADLVHQLRDQQDAWQAKYGVKTAVTGVTAIQIDVSERLSAALLPFGIFVVGLCLVLLMMVFRSIWVPIKATLGYLLSVGAAFGATQLVFNEGWLGWLVNLDQPTAIISFMPILIMGILFGLAMDYEVFLVSRMREEYVRGCRREPDRPRREIARQAIHDGFVASGKVVAAAAVIMFAVFAFFVPEGMGPIKQIAFGLALGVAVDAFLVRMTLVPAVLQLLGERAWGLPSWLEHRLPEFDVEGEGLAHQLRMRDWPSVEHHEVLHAEGLRAARHFTPVDVHLEPGQVAIVAGDATARSAALLALAGRLASTHGQARVAGELLPEQAGKVRRHTGFVEVAGNRSVSSDLRAQLRGQPRVVFVNGADGLATHDELAALGELLDRARRSATFGVILGVSDPDALASVRPDQIVRVAKPASPAVTVPTTGPDAGLAILQTTH